MTPAQIDQQTQLEQTTTDRKTQPLFKDSPVVFVEAMDHEKPATISEQIEHNTVSAKERTPPETNNDIFHETLPPPKKKYERMKDPAFLSSLVHPPILPSKLSLSTNRDDNFIPSLLHDHFTFISQPTSLYMYPLDTFPLIKTKTSSTIMPPYQYLLENGVKSFSLQLNFLRPSIYDLETDKSDPSFLSISQKTTHHQCHSPRPDWIELKAN